MASPKLDMSVPNSPQQAVASSSSVATPPQSPAPLSATSPDALINPKVFRSSLVRHSSQSSTDTAANDINPSPTRRSRLRDRLRSAHSEDFYPGEALIVGSQPSSSSTLSQGYGREQSMEHTVRSPDRAQFLSGLDSNEEEIDEEENFNAVQLMVDLMYTQCEQAGLWNRKDPFDFCVVALRHTHIDENGDPKIGFVIHPAEASEFSTIMSKFPVQVAIIFSSRTIRLCITHTSSDVSHIQLKDGNLLQILENLDYLPRARKHQWAALIRSEKALVVWSEQAEDAIGIAEKMEEQLLVFARSTEMKLGLGGIDDGVGGVIGKATDEDVEVGSVTGTSRRRYNFWAAIITALSCGTALILFSTGIRDILVDSFVDGDWRRMAWIALLPIQFLFTIFVPTAAISSIFQMVGPISQLSSNSVYYTGKPPKRLNTPILPHVTIQIAVYTESLASVIHPTIQSVKQAITTYERQGGTASIYINDDGMQVISEQEAQRRRDYYHLHSIGWCSRPKHGKDGFIRKGRFKKASNLNFCLKISKKVEDLIANGVDYQEALNRVVSEDGCAWAGGNILIGDFILQLDADTRVPEDCLLDAVSEMVDCPEVAILQFTAGVMYVVRNYWENGIGHFTDIVYASIRFISASGETAPFVGHNAMLRWTAMQEVAFEEDGVMKYWSESHVSEDFDMSLRLQIRGYIVRYAAYTGGGFQEGVSLTVYDELKRWQKYAYGCSELVFNPLRQWLFKGPITPLFVKFLTSNMNLSSKINIVGYIGSYYAIGASWPLTILNYVLAGYWNDTLDKYYLRSYNVVFTSICVFTILSTICFTIFNYRLNEATLVGGFWTNLKWTVFFGIFFSGLSFHVSLALLAHMVGYNMTWGATAKEVENSSFFKEIPKIAWGYKWMYMIFIPLTVALPVLAIVPPVEWRITELTVVLPCALLYGGHILLPIALNPYLMFFSF
ncbi:glycosyl transferase family group 2-domain-containing protein [Cladochytrium replicatum]|nr:glycosyl transferase family group 2-domain-containing protein [Cladochytrium replicatum]